MPSAAISSLSISADFLGSILGDDVGQDGGPTPDHPDVDPCDPEHDHLVLHDVAHCHP